MGNEEGVWEVENGDGKWGMGGVGKWGGVERGRLEVGGGMRACLLM